jgi:hypothetical protein
MKPIQKEDKKKIHMPLNEREKELLHNAQVTEKHRLLAKICSYSIHLMYCFQDNVQFIIQFCTFKSV